MRIRESAFNRNSDKAMEPLWLELERRGIRPGDLKTVDDSNIPDWKPAPVIEEEGLDGIEDIDDVPSFSTKSSGAIKAPAKATEERKAEIVFPREDQVLETADEELEIVHSSEELLHIAEFVISELSRFDQKVLSMRLGLGAYSGITHSVNDVLRKLGVDMGQVLTAENKLIAVIQRMDNRPLLLVVRAALGRG